MGIPPGNSSRHQESLQAFAAATPANGAVVDQGLPMDSIKAANLCQATGNDRLTIDIMRQIGIKNADSIIAAQQKPAPGLAPGLQADAGMKSPAPKQEMHADAGMKGGPAAKASPQPQYAGMITAPRPGGSA